MSKNIAFDTLFDIVAKDIKMKKINTIGSVFWKKLQGIPLIQAIAYA